MDDNEIIELYFARAETAISQTAVKYGKYCYSIAYNILSNREDSEESVNDTYLAAWNQMPPRQPSVLSAFLGKLTRYISLDRWKARNAYKRGGGEVALSLEELEESLPGGANPEKAFAEKELLRCINSFLEALPETERRVFVCRYWYLDSTQDIAERFGFSQSKVTAMLHRIRGKLRRQLEKEGLQ
ncbi:MAG: RNA polymerase sigma factor [Faecousia sp.]